MILTIGMIVKNEADKLYKCLKSLEPLRKAVSSELIIVDTGSTDDTIKIAKEFADDIREFEWCGDFSAARNKSMENIHGEWFMFIDADEWFEDVGEIVKFFNSGEYKKYNSATYIQRNYITTNINGVYSDYDAPRLSKISVNTKFVKRIHEYINTFGEPIKKINSYVHHFGYADVNEGDKEKKKKRNEELLLKSLEDDDKNISLYFQLYDCYKGYDDEKAIEYARLGIKIADETKLNYYARYVFLKVIAFAYFGNKEYEKALDVINEFKLSRSKDKDIEQFILTDVDIAAIEVHSNYNLNNFDQTFTACIKYNSAYNNYKANKYSIVEALIHPAYFANEMEYIKVNIIYFNMLLKFEKLQDAMIVIKKIGLDKITNIINREQSCFVIQDIINIAKQMNDLKIIKNVFDLEYYINNFEISPDYILALLSLAIKLDDNDTIYIALKKFKQANLLTCFGKMLVLQDFIDGYIGYLKRNDFDDVVIMNILLEISEFMIYNDTINLNNVFELFEQYSRIGFSYLSIIYKPKYLCDDNINILPSEHKKYYYCNKAFKAFENNDTKSCAFYMKKAAALNMNLKKVASAMSSVSAERTEFYTLSKQIKNNIKEYISLGNNKSALKLLDEYSQINPSDEDIIELRKILASHR